MECRLEAEPDDRAVRRYEGLLKVSKVISTHRNLSDLLAVIRAELGRVAQFDGMIITQHGPRPEDAKWHLAEFESRTMAKLPLYPPPDSPPGWVFDNQQPLVIASIEKETRFPDAIRSMREDGVQSVCVLPLTTARRRIGSIGLASARPDAYKVEDLRFLSSVADQVALAIDAALNVEELEAVEADLRRSRERLQLLLGVNNSVVSNLDFQELFRAISSSIRSSLPCDAVGIALPGGDGESLKGIAVDFPESKGALQPGTPVASSMRRVFETGVAALLPSAGEIFPDAPARVEGIRAGCHVPLLSRGKVLGVLSVGRQEEILFTQEDVQLLTEIGIQVAIAIQNALAYREIDQLKEELARENVYLEDEIRSELHFEEIIGRSEVLQRVLRQLETVGPTDSTVVIYGDTGTGKELVARALHGLSSRAKHPFVKLNCAAIPAGLLESELFGHERGAFTGAVSQRIGRFELASRGTVFLDEIGELPLELQPKLLRVLQEGEFERLGSSQTLRTNARLIAATNRDLLAMVHEQKFRADLYYRLNVFPLHVPTLRERREDIPLLVRHFVQHFARRMNKSVESIPKETMRLLVEYSWPGNIRELQNLVERAVILTGGSILNVPASELRQDHAPAEQSSPKEIETLEESERKHILKALHASDWVIAGLDGAATRLGLKRSTLQARMAKLGIRRARFAQ